MRFMKTILVFCCILFAATAFAQLPSHANSVTVDVSRIDGKFDSFRWDWVGMNDQTCRITFASSKTNGYPAGYIDLTGYYPNFRLSQGGTVYVDLQYSRISVQTSNIVFGVSRTNIPPKDSYQAEVWVYDSLATNHAVTLAQGTIKVSKSLYSDTNNFPFPTNNADLTSYATIPLFQSHTNSNGTTVHGLGTAATNAHGSYQPTVSGTIVTNGANVSALANDAGYLTSQVAVNTNAIAGVAQSNGSNLFHLVGTTIANASNANVAAGVAAGVTNGIVGTAMQIVTNNAYLTAIPPKVIASTNADVATAVASVITNAIAGVAQSNGSNLFHLVDTTIANATNANVAANVSATQTNIFLDSYNLTNTAVYRSSSNDTKYGVVTLGWAATNMHSIFPTNAIVLQPTNTTAGADGYQMGLWIRSTSAVTLSNCAVAAGTYVTNSGTTLLIFDLAPYATNNTWIVHSVNP